jgi:hypothetical protein
MSIAQQVLMLNVATVKGFGFKPSGVQVKAVPALCH